MNKLLKQNKTEDIINSLKLFFVVNNDLYFYLKKNELEKMLNSFINIKYNDFITLKNYFFKNEKTLEDEDKINLENNKIKYIFQNLKNFENKFLTKNVFSKILIT